VACTIIVHIVHTLYSLYILTLYIHCTHTVLALYSHCTRTVLALYTHYSHCTHTVLTMYSHCNRTVLTLYSHCTCIVLTLYIHCTHTVHTLCIHGTPCSSIIDTILPCRCTWMFSSKVLVTCCDSPVCSMHCVCSIVHVFVYLKTGLTILPTKICPVHSSASLLFIVMRSSTQCPRTRR